MNPTTNQPDHNPTNSRRAPFCAWFLLERGRRGRLRLITITYTEPYMKGVRRPRAVLALAVTDTLIRGVRMCDTPLENV